MSVRRGFGRREFLIGGGALGTLALGGAGAYPSTSAGSDAEPSFLLQQGYLRYEVDSISKEGTNVREFYDYTGTSASPEGDDAENLNDECVEFENDCDTVVVVDADGETVLAYTYPR